MNRRIASVLAAAFACCVALFGPVVSAYASTSPTVPRTGDVIMRYLPWIIGIVVLAVVLICISVAVRRRNDKSAPRGRHSK
ncbi:MAG: hypothetical protein ACI364_06010 [Coriobacteriales bacterium]